MRFCVRCRSLHSVSNPGLLSLMSLPMNPVDAAKTDQIVSLYYVTCGVQGNSKCVHSHPALSRGKNDESITSKVAEKVFA